MVNFIGFVCLIAGIFMMIFPINAWLKNNANITKQEMTEFATYLICGSVLMILFNSWIVKPVIAIYMS